ncbi:MAG TPA: alpha/beta hydrolase-fold protein, partial [Polyangia bacterium]
VVLALFALAAPAAARPDAPAGRWAEVRVPVPAAFAGGKAARGRMLVYVPRSRGAAPAPLVIALHGWNGRAEDWQRGPELAALAERHGVVVACPDTGKSVFESRFYPESRGRWSRVPGAVFVGAVVLPYLRAHYPVRQDRAGSAIIGYSTGGRGALVVARRYPDFGFAASLSGTYELGLLRPSEGEYKIHAVVFGPRDRWPERWRDEDVVAAGRLEPLRRMGLYLAHGGGDKVVGVSQLRAMERYLVAHQVPAQIIVAPAAGHEWRFWASQLEAVFAAFRAAPGG